MRRWGAVLLGLGLVLVVLYYGLAAADVSKIGVPTDIGGGFILLVGYLTGAAGLIVLLIDLLLRRQRR